MIKIMQDGQIIKVIERSTVPVELFDRLWERTGSIQKVMESSEILMMFAQCLNMTHVPHAIMHGMQNYVAKYPFTMLINK